jgi:hypothetical protein
MADTQNYLPTREADLLTWATNFNTQVAATPTAFGLTAGQATAFTALFTAFETAYNAANAPLTRSPVNITAKNTAKDNMIDGPGGIRELAAIIQAFPAINAHQIRELGLTVRDSSPSPIPAPTVAPEMDFIPTGTRTIRVRLHNEQTLNRKKPEGVKGATLFYHVGETAPAELNDWTFYTNTTKTVNDVELPAEIASGATVWFTAFWRNPKDQSGPATTPVSTKVQWGGLSMAA